MTQVSFLGELFLRQTDIIDFSNHESVEERWDVTLLSNQMHAFTYWKIKQQ